MPSSQKLSYDPLNAIYLQKLLAAKDSEASRRKAIQEEAERKAKATREEAQRKAEAKQKEQASQEESVRRAIAGDAAEPQLEGNDLLAWKLAYGQVIRCFFRDRQGLGARTGGTRRPSDPRLA